MKDTAQNFKIVIFPHNTPAFGSVLGYDRQNQAIESNGNSIDPNWAFVRPAMRDITGLGVNEQKEIGVGIQMPKNAVRGTYIFNIYIGYSDTPDPPRCEDVRAGPVLTQLPLNYDDCIKYDYDRTKLYGEQVYKLHITVP